MADHSENSHFMYHKLMHNPMTKLYVSQALLTFVKSLIGIFVPIYLYSLGFSLIEILMYLIGLSCMFLFTIPIAVKLINLLGFKWTILNTVPIYLLHILSLNFIQYDPIMYHVAWITFGLYNGIFWPAFHSEIAVSGHKEKRGSEIGTMQIMTILVTVVAPLIGGFVLQYFGYSFLVVIATIMLIMSAVPLIFAQDIPLHNYHFRYRDFFKFSKIKKYKVSRKAFMFEGIEHGLSLGIWPIILFIILAENFFSLGILFTIISLFSVIMITFVKNYVDTHDRRRVLKVVTKFHSLGWLLRSIIVVIGSFVVYIVESLSKLVVDVVRLTYISMFYNNAKKSKPYLDYIIMREFYLHGTRIIFLFLVVGIVALMGESIRTYSLIVLFGIIGSLGMSYMKEE